MDKSSIFDPTSLDPEASRVVLHSEQVFVAKGRQVAQEEAEEKQRYRVAHPSVHPCLYIQTSHQAKNGTA